MKVIWKPNPGKQEEALKRTEFEILYGGSRGGGKSDAGMAWLLYWIGNPKYRALVIRRNADDLSDWVDRARQMYQGTGANFAYRPTEIKFPSGAIIKTGHLRDANAFTKYQGHEYQKMVLEELTQIPREDDYLKLVGSCRSTVDGLDPQVFCTTNPGNLGHAWVKKRFVTVTDPGKPYYYKEVVQGKEIELSRIFIPATVDDNPVLIDKDPRYVAYLESLKKTNEQLYKAWRFGDWDIVAGQVFTEWMRQTHVIAPFKVPDQWDKYISIDWGVNAPFAVGWFACSTDGRIYLYRELYMNGREFKGLFGKDLTPKRLARVILSINKKNNENIDYGTADPACWNKPEGGESISETMIRCGLPLIKGDNDRYNGLGRFREMLAMAPDGKPWFQVFNSCENFIDSIPSLMYDEHKGKLEDVDTTGNDHGYDMARYFFMSRPSPSQIKVEEEYKPIREALRRAKMGYNIDDDYQEI